MSCSSSNQNGGNCCPSPQVFTENLCGNLLGLLTARAVWSVVGLSDYAQGTFEIFNSAQSLAVMTGNVGNGVEYGGIYSTTREHQDLYLLANQESLQFQ